jgi:uncharacterized protein YcfJ
MNKSMLVGTVLGAVLVTAGGGFAGYQMMNSAPAAAEVLKVTEAYKTTKVPREVCEDRVVTRQAPVKDENRIAGSVVGAVVGGLLGKQVGGGNGKKLATVAGAAAGGPRRCRAGCRTGAGRRDRGPGGRASTCRTAAGR